MEQAIQYSSTFYYYYYYAAAAVLATVIFFRWRRCRYPPGPTGLPLIGSLLSLSPDLHVYFAKLARTYGPIYSIRLGTKLAVVISSPALAREVLQDNDLAMANHGVSANARIFSYGGNDVLFSSSGPTWRMLRRICVHELLSPTSLDAGYSLRRRQVRATVAQLRSTAGEEVELGTQLFTTILNVITSMLWGGAAEEDEKEEDKEERIRVAAEFKSLFEEVQKLLVLPNVSDVFPFLAWFDLQGLQRKTSLLMERFDRIFSTLIEHRKGSKVSGDRDFLDHLLRLETEGGETKTRFTMTHVKALLMDMLAGGTDSASRTLEWAMSEMLLKPEIMRKVQQELDQVVGKDQIVEESHIPKLRYLGAVMKEVLRLHPPAPLMIPHSPTTPCTIGGYTVPRGSDVFLNVWAIQRDPSVWNDALKFDPERFLGTATNFDFKGNDFRYFPFGSGRRMCAGLPLAERMAMHTLASILHSFDWRLPDGTELDLSETNGISLKKAKPLIAIPIPRLLNSEQFV